MSALPPKADIGTRLRNVRFVPKADRAVTQLFKGLLGLRCVLGNDWGNNRPMSLYSAPKRKTDQRGPDGFVARNNNASAPPLPALI